MYKEEKWVTSSPLRTNSSQSHAVINTNDKVYDQRNTTTNPQQLSITFLMDKHRKITIAWLCDTVAETFRRLLKMNGSNCLKSQNTHTWLQHLN